MTPSLLKILLDVTFPNKYTERWSNEKEWNDKGLAAIMRCSTDVHSSFALSLKFSVYMITQLRKALNVWGTTSLISSTIL